MYIECIIVLFCLCLCGC